jgi:hypothetical protein
MASYSKQTAVFIHAQFLIDSQHRLVTQQRQGRTHCATGSRALRCQTSHLRFVSSHCRAHSATHRRHHLRYAASSHESGNDHCHWGLIHPAHLVQRAQQLATRPPQAHSRHPAWHPNARARVA